jgi:predicted DNA-binding transcriptional regulator AlpA
MLTSEVCAAVGVYKAALYRYVNPGETPTVERPKDSPV